MTKVDDLHFCIVDLKIGDFVELYNGTEYFGITRTADDNYLLATDTEENYNKEALLKLLEPKFI